MAIMISLNTKFVYKQNSFVKAIKQMRIVLSLELLAQLLDKKGVQK